MVKAKKTQKPFLFGYLIGALVTLIISLTSFFSVFDFELKKNVDALISRLFLKVAGRDSYATIRGNNLLRTPGQLIIKELNSKGANFDNTKKLLEREIGLYESLAVESDERLGFRLLPNISLRSYYLKTQKELNWDPPLLYLNNNETYSDALKSYLANNTTGSYLIESNDEGLRKTYPIVKSEKKILVIGDSVAFGLGVDDDKTFPSQLQRKLGQEYQVLNAALSGYDMTQGLALLEKYKESKIEKVVLIICENDLKSTDTTSRVSELKTIVNEVSQYQSYYPNITLVLHHNIYDINAPFFRPKEQDYIEERNRIINKELRKEASLTGMTFINWFNLVERYKREEKSLFASLSLYVDHCHFSTKGNYLLATTLHEEVFLK